MGKYRSYTRSTIALWILGLTSFGIGLDEFVIPALLPDIAQTFQVTIVAAGFLVTAYALGVAVGGPFLIVATLRMQRKRLLLGLVGFFVLGNVLCATAPTYTLLLIGRLVVALVHGAFVGVASVVAIGLVAPSKSAHAISIVIGGFTLATVLGVPLGTWVGQVYGWRAVFWCTAAITAITWGGIAITLPKRSAKNTDIPNLSLEIKALRRPQVLLALAMTAFGFGGLFAAYTYIAPILEQITGIAPGTTPFILLFFGIGGVVGNTIGGKAASKSLMFTLIVFLGTLAVTLAIFPFTSRNPLAATLTIFVLGATSFGATPGLQTRVINKAKDAPYLASTLNITAFNFGNALGAFSGGLMVQSPLGLASAPWAGAFLTFIGVAAAAYSIKLEKLALSK